MAWSCEPKGWHMHRGLRKDSLRSSEDAGSKETGDNLLSPFLLKFEIEALKESGLHEQDKAIGVLELGLAFWYLSK